MRTADLMRRNRQLEREIAGLREDADALLRDVLSNPENAALAEAHRRAVAVMAAGEGVGGAAAAAAEGTIAVDANMDFWVVRARGQAPEMLQIR